MHPRTRPATRRAVCAALLLTQITACMTWSRVPGTIAQQSRSEPIPSARLLLRSGAELPLRDVTVRADSVVGYLGNARERRAVPVADVASIERRKLSGGRTTALVVGTAAVAFAVLFAAATASLANNIGAVPAPGIP